VGKPESFSSGGAAMLHKSFRLLIVIAICGSIGSRALADDTPTKVDRAALDQAIAKGIDFLRVKGQAADGSYTAQAGPAFTAICTLAVLDNGRSPDDPQVAKSLKYLEGFVQPDGRICSAKSRIPNYETCVTMMCFAAANKDGRYKKILADAEKFIRSIQSDETKSVDVSDPSYGGAGYGSGGRADLSNTAYLLEALEATGVKGDDEAVKKALVFVSRCQNLESEHNTLPFAAKDPDGGFIYTPAAGGNSAAGRKSEQEEAALKSYGSMSYAGLKSMIYAGVKADDPRIVAVTKWLRKNYSVSENPGMGPNGLFYYYHTMGKSLAALGQDQFEDSRGKQHDWKNELAVELIKRQNAEGFWVNDATRWMEGDPNLCTAFALITLSYCKPAK
jgi:squalene-hopene/tetraprenyl-beta-curcumene cyclase